MSLNKTNVQGFVKDSKSGMVTNTDAARLEEYKMARNKAKEFKAMKEEIESLKKRVTVLESFIEFLSKQYGPSNFLVG